MLSLVDTTVRALFRYWQASFLISAAVASLSACEPSFKSKSVELSSCSQEICHDGSPSP